MTLTQYIEYLEQRLAQYKVSVYGYSEEERRGGRSELENILEELKGLEQ